MKQNNYSILCQCLGAIYFWLNTWAHILIGRPILRCCIYFILKLKETFQFNLFKFATQLWTALHVMTHCVNPLYLFGSKFFMYAFSFCKCKAYSIHNYRVGHEKVARVRKLEWWVKANNMRSRTTSGWGEGGWLQHDCWLTDQTDLRNRHTNARENITRICAKRKAGYFFVAHSV